MSIWYSSEIVKGMGEGSRGFGTAARLSKVYGQVHESLVQQGDCQKHMSRFMRVWYSRGVAKSISEGS